MTSSDAKKRARNGLSAPNRNASQFVRSNPSGTPLRFDARLTLYSPISTTGPISSASTYSDGDATSMRLPSARASTRGRLRAPRRALPGSGGAAAALIAGGG